MWFSDLELAYLRTQILGRLATIAPDGFPQNNPVGFLINESLKTIDIGGHMLGRSRKFSNVQARPEVSLVIDDLASTNPWHVRGVEIRGRAEALAGIEPPRPGLSGELIRIHPTRVRSWGLEA
jgi:pyridoxamine 5'-phosphate oxidase family protein